MKDLKMVIFLLLTTTLCTLMLGGVNLAYQRAASIFNVRLYGEILDLFEIEVEEDEVESLFAQHFDVRQVGDTTYYLATQKNPGTVVFKAEGPGLWSRIEALVAVNPDRETLLGIRILAQAETPGLGGRIGESGFQQSFAGVYIQPALQLVKFAMAENEVDAISGATRTSVALQDIINKGVARMTHALREEH
jgi:Na+-translocating ferredoxin:NAD+ oxidoreductase RnfG subunit